MWIPSQLHQQWFEQQVVIMSCSLVTVLILLCQSQHSSGYLRLYLQGILLPKLVFLSASERQNWSLGSSEMRTQTVLLIPNEKQSLWSESHSVHGAVVYKLTTCISRGLDRYWLVRDARCWAYGESLYLTRWLLLVALASAWRTWSYLINLSVWLEAWNSSCISLILFLVLWNNATYLNFFDILIVYGFACEGLSNRPKSCKYSSGRFCLFHFPLHGKPLNYISKISAQGSFSYLAIDSFLRPITKVHPAIRINYLVTLANHVSTTYPSTDFPLCP